jgi:hypothetical protein
MRHLFLSRNIEDGNARTGSRRGSRCCGAPHGERPRPQPADSNARGSHPLTPPPPGSSDRVCSVSLSWQRLASTVSRAFPSWNRSILTEIYLCHACSDHEREDENARTGHLRVEVRSHLAALESWGATVRQAEAPQGPGPAPNMDPSTPGVSILDAVHFD